MCCRQDFFFYFLVSILEIRLHPFMWTKFSTPSIRMNSTTSNAHTENKFHRWFKFPETDPFSMVVVYDYIERQIVVQPSGKTHINGLIFAIRYRYTFWLNIFSIILFVKQKKNEFIIVFFIYDNVYHSRNYILCGLK